MLLQIIGQIFTVIRGKCLYQVPSESFDL